MGYNGSNRKGYDVRYRGLSKSSMVPGNNLLKGLTLAGLFGVSKLVSGTPSPRDFVTGFAAADFSRNGQGTHSKLSQKGVTIIVCILLALVTPLQYVCYYSFRLGWWPFFSFLVFGSLALLCLGLAEWVLDSNANISPSRWKVFAWSIFLMTIANIGYGLWPFWLVEWDFLVLVHALVICQDIISLIFLLYLRGASDRFKIVRIQK